MSTGEQNTHHQTGLLTGQQGLLHPLHTILLQSHIATDVRKYFIWYIFDSAFEGVEFKS